MQIVINLDEDEITERAKRIAADNLASDIRNRCYLGNTYKNLCKEVIREAIAKNIDDLSERAVVAAAKSIENKAIKKLFEQLAGNYGEAD